MIENTLLWQKAATLRKRSGLPLIGMGTFGSDKYDAATVSSAVYYALKCGYRLLDCASVYGNEKQIGEVLKKAFADGIVDRTDLIVASKVWNDMHGEGDVIKSCKQTLSDLQLDYLDIYFVHWPYPNYHAPGCSGDARNPNSRPFSKEEFMIVWRQMEELKNSGMVKNIAMSNMTVAKFKEILPLCKIAPFAHEMELHPSFQQKELFAYCVERDIVPIGYCPIGSPNRPDRDKASGDVVDTELSEVIEIAEKMKIHPVEVCLKWAVQRGQIPIPFSSNPRNIENNLKTVQCNPISAELMEKLMLADKNCRFIKGQVFLWEGAADWRALWDENGKITK